MTNTCTGSWYDNHGQRHTCGHPVKDRILCKNCTDHLERRIGDLPALHDDLVATMARLGRIGERSEGRSAETTLFVSKAAMEAGTGLTRGLAAWVALVTVQGDVQPRETIQSRVNWLLTHYQRIPLHTHAGAIVEQVNDTTRALLVVIDLPEDKRTFPVGLCPEVNEQGQQCPGEIRAHIPAEEGRPARMRCTACGVVYETWQWTKAGKRIRAIPAPLGQIRGPVLGGIPRHTRPAVDDELGPYPPGAIQGGRHTATAGTALLDGVRTEEVLAIVDAARITNIPAGTIRRWLAEGRLHRHGDRKPYGVDLDELEALRDTLRGDVCFGDR